MLQVNLLLAIRSGDDSVHWPGEVMPVLHQLVYPNSTGADEPEHHPRGHLRTLLRLASPVCVADDVDRNVVEQAQCPSPPPPPPKAHPADQLHPPEHRSRESLRKSFTSTKTCQVLLSTKEEKNRKGDQGNPEGKGWMRLGMLYERAVTGLNQQQFPSQCGLSRYMPCAAPQAATAWLAGQAPPSKG